MSGFRTAVKGTLAIGATGLVVAVSACTEEPPTGVGNFPAEPVTVEILLPWSAFASNLEVFGGYGAPADIGLAVLATDYAGTLNARTLVRFTGYPTTATVRDSTGTSRTDSELTFIGGRVVAVFDTISSTNTGPVTIALGALQEEWHPPTVSWTQAVDTINDSRLWSEAGAGPVTPIATADWNPASGDSVLIPVDSATIAAWADTTDASQGARLELITPGERVHVLSAFLRLDVRPSLDPDTLIELSAGPRETTFVYDPVPAPPPDGIRIGGAPSWRSVMDVDVPGTLDGIAALCGVVSCPHALHESEVSYAGLVLTSRASEPAFQPTDSIGFDVRSVLLRSALPKAPLGSSLITGFGRWVSADAFGSQPGQTVDIPVTPLVRSLVAGDDGSGNPPSNSLALLSVLEPLSISFASFDGPGSPGEPMLRLVLTIGPPVELP